MKSLLEYARETGVFSLDIRTSPPKFEIGRDDLWTIDSSGLRKDLPKKQFIEPPELGDFRREVKAFEIFPLKPKAKSRSHKYVWTVLDTEMWMNSTMNERLVHSSDEEMGAIPYFTQVFDLIENDFDGVIGVDTHPDRLGWIGYYWYQANLSYGGFPVVAHSFREWLERTVKAGPNKLYWEEDDFVDLGPAIPSDSDYNGPREGPNAD